jgi:DNA-binding NarL/FixJ family response regulator
MTSIRVVVADDHPVVRSGISALLSSLTGFTVVGMASDGAQAIKECQLTQPDVLILDLKMPGLDGLAATREITRSVPSVAILILTMFDDDESVFAAMRAGARGYLVKGAEQDEIARAVRAVASGELIFGPAVASRVAGFFAAPRTAPGTAPPFPQLTTREREILDLLAGGMSNAAIGARLGIAGKTVANNVSAVFTKLQVADRSQAIVRARDAGLGRD